MTGSDRGRRGRTEAEEGEDDDRLQSEGGEKEEG